MSARTDIADHLQAALLTYKVVPYPVDVDGVKDVTVLVWRESVEHGVSLAVRANEIVVWVLSGMQDPRKAEDALEEALDAVLAVLDDLDTQTWDRAERGVYAEKFHGWRVTLTLATTTEE